MSDLAIEVDDIVKVYDKSKTIVRALDGVSLQVRKGEIFGLLGRNGAGKTTLLRILTTLVKPSSGTARVMGYDVQESGLDVRRNICAVLQENALEMFLSVKDNLMTFARFHSIPSHERENKAQRAIEQFGLEEHANMKVMDLSGGLKRRLQVAKVFMVDKPLVFLDEATTGMDPVNKRAVLTAIQEQASKGRTIFLTTHILQEAEELCDTIAMINHGRIIATGDITAIKALTKNVFEIRVTFEDITPDIVQALRSLPTIRFEQNGNSVDLRMNDVETDMLETIAALSRISRIVHLEINGGTLEDAFIELLGDAHVKTP